MTTTAGKDGIVKNGTNTIAETRNWSITRSGATADTTAMGDDWETHMPTINNWEGSIACFWDQSDTQGQVALVPGASVTLNLYPEGDTTGDKYYSGTATVTQVQDNGSHDGIVESSFSFKGNGALTPSTVS